MCIRDRANSSDQVGRNFMMHNNAHIAAIDLVVRCDLNCWVWGDAGLLTTAVRNLVVNAVAYSGSGTRVAVRALIAADGAREVIVSDQGQGIPESELLSLIHI